MWYFGNPGKAQNKAMQRPETHLGAILTPLQGNKLPSNAVHIKDNGRYGNGWVSFGKWITFLEQHAEHRDRCLFAVAPDVIADAQATLELSGPWLAAIRALGHKAALVAQNGLTVEQAPWGDFDVLFLGGVLECLPCEWIAPCPDSDVDDEKPVRCPSCGRLLTEWKLGAQAYGLAVEAKRRGMWVHMGRVNSFKRLLAAYQRGCDSVDGTFIAMGPDQNLPKVLGWLREINDQYALCPPLGGAA